MSPVSPAPDERRPLLNENHSIENVANSNWKLLVILSGVYLGGFTAALDSTLVATLSGPISASFGSLPLLSWLASAYFIATAVSQPLSGKLTDIYGRLPGLLLANAVFAIGNLICACSHSASLLILGRVVAGIGGGGLAPIASFVMSDLVPLRSRALWQGVGNICWGLGSGVGGYYGGLVNDTIGWRWAFIIQVPISVLAMVLVAINIRIPVEQSKGTKLERIDVLGALALVATMVLMLLGLSSAGNTVAWTHPLVLTSLPLAAVFLFIFVLVEVRYAAEPIIPLRLFANRTVAAVCLTHFFSSMARFGLLFYGPIYFQVQGYSPSQTGLRFIADSTGIGITSLSCGIVVRSTGRYLALGGLMQVIFLAGLGLIITLMLDTPPWPPFIYLFLVGVGFSGMLTTTVVALVASVEQKYQAVTTSASYACRSTGSVVGIAISGAIYQNVLKKGLWRRLGGLRDAKHLIEKVENNLRAMHDLDPDLERGIMQVHMYALRHVFFSLLAVAVLGAVSNGFVKEYKLYNTMARSEDAEE
ncbi:MAG: hypothetical protein ASARMPREDX12_004283 [Alectoria sarmentosa]|nr:MAG: hypothetical protein ASARMPREDX12_004283 [Alectoria sarmentosa]